MTRVPVSRRGSVRLGVLGLAVWLLTIAGPLRAQQPAAPSKESAVTVLRGLLAALQAPDYAKAVTFFQIPPGLTAEVLQKEAARFIERREISGPGIDILAEKGKWGKLAETVEPARAQRFAEKFGVALDGCYGLTLGDAEAGFFWDGKQLKLIRCDDIGKLAP